MTLKDLLVESLRERSFPTRNAVDRLNKVALTVVIFPKRSYKAIQTSTA